MPPKPQVDPKLLAQFFQPQNPAQSPQTPPQQPQSGQGMAGALSNLWSGAQNTYHAFADAPQGPAEQAVNQGTMGRLNLGILRMAQK